MIEKRAVQRHRVFKGATIAFESREVACTVRNLSSAGAAIDLDGRILLPPSFTLSICSDQFVSKCRMVWRNDQRLGLAFEQ